MVKPQGIPNVNEGSEGRKAKKQPRILDKMRCLVPPMQPFSMFCRLPVSSCSRHVVGKWKPGAGASVSLLQCRRPPHNPGVTSSYQGASFSCRVSASSSLHPTRLLQLCLGSFHFAVADFLSELLLDVSRFRRVAANLDKETPEQVMIDVILGYWVSG